MSPPLKFWFAGFPTMHYHARSIRRLEAEDATFRAICEDYADALRALEHWRNAGRSAQHRVEQYRQLVTELEHEVLATLAANERG